MSKPLFFTGRKEIANSDVYIRLQESDGAVPRFRAQIELDGYALPSDAVVIVEAYHNAYFKRFEAGTVDQLQLSRVYELEGLELGDRPLFRVKVIGPNGDAGRLLAAIDAVKPATEDEAGSIGSLLPLIPKTREQMGDEFWRVNFTVGDELQPELWINKEVSGLFAALQNQDPKVTAFIMPEILRRVLCGLVEDGAPWTDEGSLGQWLTFAKEFYPDQYEESDDDKELLRQKRRDWVDSVVWRFATAHRLFERYHDQLQVTSLGENDD